MDLNRKQVEAFQKAYKESCGEEIEYKEAYEMAHRLVNIFLILDKASREQKVEEQD